MTHILAAAALALTMTGAPATALTGAGAQNPPAQVNDRAVNPSQPDFTIVGLPTTLKIPKFASSFRVTHRFTRPLGDGDFGDLARDLFGFDAGAQVGLEYRFGIWSGMQLGIHRTSDRTIQFFAQYHLLDQGASPVGIDILGSAEGTNNFRDQYSPGIGAVISRTLGRYGAIYAHPIYVNNTNPLTSSSADNSTFILGLGGRVRVRPTVYVVAEAAPRTGYEPDSIYASFAIEKRAGGHSFQVNISNGFGTTLGQMARGGQGADTWFIGFNISRKFF